MNIQDDGNFLNNIGITYIGNSPPNNPISGQYYFNQNTKNIYIYNSGKWQNLSKDEYEKTIQDFEEYIKCFCNVINEYTEFAYIKKITNSPYFYNNEVRYNYLQSEFEILKKSLVKDGIFTQEKLDDIENSVKILLKLNE